MEEKEIYTPENVQSEIRENVYKNGLKTFSVISKLNAHTFVNQAETIEEAENIKQLHITQLIQLYVPTEHPDTKAVAETKTAPVIENVDTDNDEIESIFEGNYEEEIIEDDKDDMFEEYNQEDE